MKERDGYRCLLCGATDDLTVDHIRALTDGGTNDNDNLRTLCRSCNSGRCYGNATYSVRIEHLAVSAGMDVDATQEALDALGVHPPHGADRYGRMAWVRPWNPWIALWDSDIGRRVAALHRATVAGPAGEAGWPAGRDGWTAAQRQEWQAIVDIFGPVAAEGTNSKLG